MSPSRTTMHRIRVKSFKTVFNCEYRDVMLYSPLLYGIFFEFLNDVQHVAGGGEYVMKIGRHSQGNNEV